MKNHNRGFMTNWLRNRESGSSFGNAHQLDHHYQQLLIRDFGFVIRDADFRQIYSNYRKIYDDTFDVIFEATTINKQDIYCVLTDKLLGDGLLKFQLITLMFTKDQAGEARDYALERISHKNEQAKYHKFIPLLENSITVGLIDAYQLFESNNKFHQHQPSILGDTNSNPHAQLVHELKMQQSFDTPNIEACKILLAQIIALDFVEGLDYLFQYIQQPQSLLFFEYQMSVMHLIAYHGAISCFRYLRKHLSEYEFDGLYCEDQLKNGPIIYALDQDHNNDTLKELLLNSPHGLSTELSRKFNSDDMFSETLTEAETELFHDYANRLGLHRKNQNLFSFCRFSGDVATIILIHLKGNVAQFSNLIDILQTSVLVKNKFVESFLDGDGLDELDAALYEGNSWLLAAEEFFGLSWDDDLSEKMGECEALDKGCIVTFFEESNSANYSNSP